MWERERRGMTWSWTQDAVVRTQPHPFEVNLQCRKLLLTQSQLSVTKAGNMLLVTDFVPMSVLFSSLQLLHLLCMDPLNACVCFYTFCWEAQYLIHSGRCQHEHILLPLLHSRSVFRLSLGSSSECSEYYLVHAKCVYTQTQISVQTLMMAEKLESMYFVP